MKMEENNNRVDVLELYETESTLMRFKLQRFN